VAVVGIAYAAVTAPIVEPAFAEDTQSVLGDEERNVWLLLLSRVNTHVTRLQVVHGEVGVGKSRKPTPVARPPSGSMARHVWDCGLSGRPDVTTNPLHVVTVLDAGAGAAWAGPAIPMPTDRTATARPANDLVRVFTSVPVFES